MRNDGVKQDALARSEELSGAWPGPLRAAVFDVGETLVDETTEYGAWADWLGVPRHTFSAIFGAVLAAGQDSRQVFQRIRPGFDLDLERRRRAEAGVPETFGSDDLYPDARRCLAALRAQRLIVGIAGNQTARAEELLRGLDLPADWIGTSAGWGVEKPSPAFFSRLVGECGCRPGQVAYIGDRLDNDVGPAHRVGLVAVHVRRGPWAHVVPGSGSGGDLEVEGLAELPERLLEFDRRRRPL